MTAESKNELLGYIDNFENWVNVKRENDDDNALVVNYHFSCADIDESDYLYISDRDGEAIGEGVYSKYDSYNVYLFDSQTTTLYYFHNNI